MSWVRVFCKKPGCLGEFKVDESVPFRKCHKCGTLHTAPWGQHDPRREPPENNYPPVLTCERCFEEFDVRREPSCEYQTNMYRCPKCGLDHSEKDYDPETEKPAVEPEVVEAEPVAVDGGKELPPEIFKRAEAMRDALEEADSGGDLHLHFH